MFSSPRLFDQYVRLNYYVAVPGDHRPQVVRELIYPSLADDDVRLTYAFRDKAVSTAMERFVSARDRGQSDQGALANLVPLMRYFAKRYLEMHPIQSSMVVRTDIWNGAAPIPAPGQSLSAKDWLDRVDVLRDYQGGPSPTLFAGKAPTLLTLETEADIVWRLEYIDQP